MRKADDGVIALVALAAILAGWLAASRYVDQHRDRDNAQLVDLLHLSALVRQQDALRWQAAVVGSPGGALLNLAPALQVEAEISSRLAYLRRTGMAAGRAATVAGPIDTIEADLRRLHGRDPAATATSALQTRISGEVADAANRLTLVEAPLRTSTGRDDLILDAGSAVTLLLPVVALLVVLARRRFSRPPPPAISTPPAGTTPPAPSWPRSPGR